MPVALIPLIGEAVLTVAGWVFGWFKSEDEKQKWLAKNADKLHKNGWARSSYIVKLAENRSKYLDEKLSKIEQERKKAKENGANSNQ